MGTITNDISVAFDLFAKNVPVWLVRPPAIIPQDINITQQAALVDPHPSLGVVVDRWPNAPVFYNGALSPGLYFATGKWRPGTIDLSRVGPETLPAIVPAPAAVQEDTVATLRAPATTGATSSPRVSPVLPKRGQCFILIRGLTTYEPLHL